MHWNGSRYAGSQAFRLRRNSEIAGRNLSGRHPGNLLSPGRGYGCDPPGILDPGYGFFKEDLRLAFNVLVDLTAVDYLERRPRFEVVYHLLSMSGNRRLRVKILWDENIPGIDSVSGLWKSANWLEREVWDMFGIRFAGHPDLKRILLYEEFEGHPLRKDYPIRKRQPLIGPKI